MPLGTEVVLDPGYIVLDGDPDLSPPKRGTAAPDFSAHVCCGQTAGWIMMLLSMEVGLGPADKTNKRGTAAPTFWPMSWQTAGGSGYHFIWR